MDFFSVYCFSPFVPGLIRLYGITASPEFRSSSHVSPLIPLTLPLAQLLSSQPDFVAKRALLWPALALKHIFFLFLSARPT